MSSIALVLARSHRLPEAMAPQPSADLRFSSAHVSRSSPDLGTAV